MTFADRSSSSFRQIYQHVDAQTIFQNVTGRQRSSTKSSIISLSQNWKLRFDYEGSFRKISDHLFRLQITEINICFYNDAFELVRSCVHKAYQSHAYLSTSDKLIDDEKKEVEEWCHLRKFKTLAKSIIHLNIRF